jgi:hypothetical protein
MPEERSAQEVKTQNRVSLCVVQKKPRASLLQRIVQFLSRIIFSSTAKKKKSACAPGASFTLAKAQTDNADTAAVTVSVSRKEIPANKNPMRRMAEQQFMHMDTSQTTMN